MHPRALFPEGGIRCGSGAPPSILQIEINGRRGWAYQHPQWHDVPGNKYWDEIEVELPTSSLKQGVNKLVLTAIDEPASVDDFSILGLAYDALELDQDPRQTFAPGKITIQSEPTIFYQQKGDQLVELVDVYVRHNSPSREGRIDLNLGDKKFSGELASSHDFGEERVEFAVPEFAPGTKGEALRIGRQCAPFRGGSDTCKEVEILGCSARAYRCRIYRLPGEGV